MDSNNITKLDDYLIIENNIVTNVILWDGNTNTWTPPENSIYLLRSSTPEKTRGNVHYDVNPVLPDGSIVVRPNYANLGHIYDSENDVFYAPSPYPSWKLNNSTYSWEPPIPKPTDGSYIWNETNTEWQALSTQQDTSENSISLEHITELINSTVANNSTSNT